MKRKRVPRVKHPNADVYEKEFKPLEIDLNWRIRWMYLLDTQKTALSDIIREVYGLKSNNQGYNFTSPQATSLDQIKVFKSVTLHNMQVSIPSSCVCKQSNSPVIPARDKKADG